MTKDQAANHLQSHLQLLYSYAWSKTGHRQEAEDLAGDIVLEVLDSISRLKEDAAFWGFFWSVAENTYRNYCKKRVRERTALKELAPYVAEDAVCDSGQNRMEDLLPNLRRELAMLSSYHRQCTVLYYFDRKKCADIALELGLSQDMVKYYLFKTRKLLREGIGMDRTFGEKSYRPGSFEFLTVFSGEFNAEYRTMFTRKLPGQILLSAYYTPVTLPELCMELGVASVYMEDELALLQQYHLINKTSMGRYQTNLIILTDEYVQALRQQLDCFVPEAIKTILRGVRRYLPSIRQMGFGGCALDDNKLLWALFVMLVFEGFGPMEKAPCRSQLYRGATGINYGRTYDLSAGEYSADMLAGYSDMGGCGYATYIHFGILNDDGAWINDRVIEQKIRGTPQDTIVSFTREQKRQLLERLSEERDEMVDLFRRILSADRHVLQSMIPAQTKEDLEEVVNSTCFIETAGYLGNTAVQCGELYVPEDGTGTAFFLTRKDPGGSDTPKL